MGRRIGYDRKHNLNSFGMVHLHCWAKGKGDCLCHERRANHHRKEHDSLRKLGSVGCTSPFFEIRILRSDGTECAPDEIGEICGRGPIMMTGYYKQPELTAKAIVEGWLHTGDAGYLDSDGYLFLVDRIKDMIISGGINVYPRDIEEVLVSHPAVRETAVFGVPDAKWGEVPVAAVVLKDGATVTQEELIAWTNARVGAKYQRVQDVTIFDEFPRNVAGKPLKWEMRAVFGIRAKDCLQLRDKPNPERQEGK